MTVNPHYPALAAWLGAEMREASNDHGHARTYTETEVSCVSRRVAYIRRNDCDFLTTETLSVYTGLPVDKCRAIMVSALGLDPRLVG